jgi:uncharacterized protein (TIGR00369 family)
MTADEVNAFLDREFPQIHLGSRAYSVVEVSSGTAVVRLDATEAHLRPGGTVSGPALFALADLAAYAAILAHIGPVALAVTTNVTINFMRKPPQGPLEGTCRIMKLGKRLAVVDVEIARPGQGELVAHAVATYSIPAPAPARVS